MSMISIIDYGMGNLRSVQKALELIGVETVITDDVNIINNSKGMILPGVGAFPDAMQNLTNKGLKEVILKNVEQKKPLLGICLGMQLLFEEGEEVKKCSGLGIMNGCIKRLKDNVKIPHMGWNNIEIIQENELLEGIENKDYMYFVHSYYADIVDRKILKSTTKYGQEVPAVVSLENVYGVQFHPEKSGTCGLKILENFVKISKCI
jgi:imidazole glycerol-phosphate synthase subunit HisH